MLANNSVGLIDVLGLWRAGGGVSSLNPALNYQGATTVAEFMGGAGGSASSAAADAAITAKLAQAPAAAALLATGAGVAFAGSGQSWDEKGSCQDGSETDQAAMVQRCRDIEKDYHYAERKAEECDPGIMFLFC